MSERYQNQRNYEQAIKYYREALQHQPDDATALLALARLYMQVCHTEPASMSSQAQSP